MATAHPIVKGVRFKNIPSIPGYCAGDDGSIWCNRYGNQHGCFVKEWRQIKPIKRKKDGYLIINLMRQESGKNVQYQQYVGWLVLEAFVGPRPNGMECCHFPDRNPENNRLSNLRWDTKEANRQDAEIHGTISRGETSGMAKLRTRDVIKIRSLYADGMNRAKLSRKFRVSWSTIDRATKRNTWKHV